MNPRSASAPWCWAGLIVAALLGFWLADARDLFSLTERLASVDLGLWLSFSDIRLEDIHWSFRVTPLAAWWGIACGGLVCLIGWHASVTEDAMPFGSLGGLSLLMMLVSLFADNLLVAALGWCGQSLIVGFWLAREARTPAAVRAIQRTLGTLLVSDTLWLLGVLLIGLSWRSFELTSLASPDFVQQGWQARPALCGFAGTCLFLGLLGRCGLFPFFGSLHATTESSGSMNAWAFGLGGGPIAVWFFLRLWPILSCSPETADLIQKLGLLGATVGAFLATAQPDPRRAVALLVSSQLGLVMSAAIVPDVLDPIVIALPTWCMALAAITLFFALRRNEPSAAFPSLQKRVSVACALLMVAGACPAATFWIAGGYLERAAEFISSIPQDPPIEEATDQLQETSTESLPMRPKPMPVLAWTAAWCLSTFWSAFAAWRIWRSSSQVESRSINGTFTGLTAGMLVCSLATAAWIGRVVSDWSVAAHGPFWCGIAASLAGWLLSAWISRDPQLIEERLQQLGSWTRLSRGDLYFDDALRWGIDVPIRGLTQLMQFADSLARGAGLRAAGGVVREAVTAVKELRNEPASFYAVALLLTIGSLLLTWLSLIG